jgi:hypothetical protein
VRARGKEAEVPKRKASWAIAIWTAFMAIAIFAAALGIGEDWLNGAVGLTLLGVLWFVGFVPLWIVWSLSRPKATTPG